MPTTTQKKPKRDKALAQQIKPEPRTLGELIQTRRKELAMSLRELARRSGVGHSFLSSIERDLGFCSAEYLAKIASTLGLSPKDLERHNTSLPIEDLRRLADRSPEFRVALRCAIHKIRSGQMCLDELIARIQGN